MQSFHAERGGFLDHTETALWNVSCVLVMSAVSCFSQLNLLHITKNEKLKNRYAQRLNYESFSRICKLVFET